jgi:hypothetical protein
MIHPRLPIAFLIAGLPDKLSCVFDPILGSKMLSTPSPELIFGEVRNEFENLVNHDSKSRSKKAIEERGSGSCSCNTHPGAAVFPFGCPVDLLVDRSCLGQHLTLVALTSAVVTWKRPCVDTNTRTAPITSATIPAATIKSTGSRTRFMFMVSP